MKTISRKRDVVKIVVPAALLMLLFSFTATPMYTTYVGKVIMDTT
jgi:hypothetical protein